MSLFGKKYQNRKDIYTVIGEYITAESLGEYITAKSHYVWLIGTSRHGPFTTNLTSLETDYTPVVDKFEVGKRYINEDSGKVHEAVYVNEKYAVLVSENHWPYSVTHEYLKSNGGIFVVES